MKLCRTLQISGLEQGPEACRNQGFLLEARMISIMEGRVFMSGKKKCCSRLLIFVSLLFLLACLPQNALHTKAAVKLSRTRLVLTEKQKLRLRVYGLPKGVSLVWKSSKPSVATVSRGTVTARRRGNAVISVNVLKNGKRLARRVCSLRVAEAPVVVASLGVSGEESEHIAEIGFTVIGKRSALLTNKIVLQTPGQSWQNLYLLDVDKINSSNGKQLGWLKGKTIPPYNNNDRNIVVAYYARKDYRSFRVTSSSKAVFYFYYDGIRYKASAKDLDSAVDPRPCKLIRLTPLSPA